MINPCYSVLSTDSYLTCTSDTKDRDKRLGKVWLIKWDNNINSKNYPWRVNSNPK